MRTRQSPGEGSRAGYGRVPPHLHAGAVEEAAAGRDEQIAQMFRSMRSAMALSRETIARRLATSPATVDNLEAGAIAALPHGKETARIVRAYCELLRMDPGPILRRIQDRLAALASQPRPPPAHPTTPRVLRSVRSARTSPPAARSEPAAEPRSRRRVRRLF